MGEAIFGFVGVILGAVITVARELWSEHQTRKKNAEYIAIRVVCMLDRYIEGCTEIVSDDGLCCGQPNAEGCLEIQVPEPQFNLQFDGNVDWKALPAELMYEILSFPNDIDSATRLIEHDIDVTGPPYDEAFEERQYQYVLLGLKASKLAEKLRQKYKLPEREVKDWDPVKYLEESKNKTEEVRLKRNDHQII